MRAIVLLGVLMVGACTQPAARYSVVQKRADDAPPMADYWDHWAKMTATSSAIYWHSTTGWPVQVWSVGASR